MLKKLLDIEYHPKLVEIMIKGSSPSIYISGIIIPLLISSVMYGFIDLYIIVLWVSLNLLLFLIRVSVLYKIKKLLSQNKELKPYICLNISVVFATTLLYAFALVYLSFYVPDIELFFMAVLMLSMIAGSMSAHIGVFHTYAINVVINSLSIISVFFIHGGQIFYIFAFTTTVFMFVMLKNGYLHYQSLRENIILKETFQERVKSSTQELQAQNEKLNASLKNFQDLLDSSIVMIIFHTREGLIIELNKEIVSTFGFQSKESVIGRNIREFIPQKSLPIVLESITKDYTAPYELILKKVDGTEFPVLISGKNTMLDSQLVRMVSMMDLSETKEKDMILRKQAKLAQMGEMLSMIAHQWRQPLSAISAASIGLHIKSQLGTADKESVFQATKDIADYAQHLSSTIDDFRNFFKPNKELKSVDFCELTESVLSLVEKPLMNRHIKLIVTLECKTKFLTYPNELKQVMLNLIQNSQDALMESKEETPYIKIVAKEDHLHEFPFILEVSDNAGGIKIETIEKVFEPYFSTKLEKNGTGLGLYMSKTIVEEHCNGRLSVENIENGVLFRIAVAPMKEIVCV
jgi:PAS domain S-box-containing protein